MHIRGDNLEGVTITGENDESAEVLNITTDSEEVLITGDETGLHGLIDEDKDGTFEKEITDSEVASGTCGDNLTYTVKGTENNLTLTINGSGEMYDFDSSSIPWKEYAGQIKSLNI